MRWQPMASVALAATLVAGCLERKETIRVTRDGAAEIRLEYTGAAADFEGGDALPQDGVAGWNVELKHVAKDDSEEIELRGRLEIAAGKPLPDSFAESGDEAHKTSLRFPTTIKVEKRRDGTYYHFRRTYEARQHARFEIYRTAAGGDEKLKELGGKEPSEMTDEQRREVIAVLRAVEAGKRAEFVSAAAATMREKWPQHYGLLLRQAVLDVFNNADMDPLVALLASEADAERDAAINRAGDELVSGAREVLEALLKEWQVPRGETSAFFAAYDEQEQRRVVTEDLADERWKIELVLPGELVAHNGVAQEDGSVLWEFDASALNDREQELMATSRVGRPGEADSADD